MHRPQPGGGREHVWHASEGVLEPVWTAGRERTEKSPTNDDSARVGGEAAVATSRTPLVSGGGAEWRPKYEYDHAKFQSALPVLSGDRLPRLALLPPAVSSTPSAARTVLGQLLGASLRSITEDLKSFPPEFLELVLSLQPGFKVSPNLHQVRQLGACWRPEWCSNGGLRWRRRICRSGSSR